MRIRNREVNVKKLIWYGGMVLLGLVSLSLVFKTHGLIWKNLVFSNFTDFCMDFFNHIRYVSGRNPYSYGAHACFPPFAYMIYYFIYRCIPSVEEGNPILWGSMREACIGNGQAGIYFVLLIYMVVITILLTLVLMDCKKGSKGEKVFFVFLIVFSSPYLFMWERGNIVILSNIFLLLFLWGKDSDMAWIRELSCLSLAASAGLKLYPAVAGILLLHERRWKEAGRTVLYGLAFFALPFLLFGGMDGFLQWKDNILVINGPNEIESQALSILNFINLLEVNMELQMPVLKKVLPFVAAIIGGVSLWGLDRKWKKAAVLCVLMIACPGWSGQYTLILMTGPLILFLDDEDRKYKWLEMLYAVLFLGLFSCIVQGEIKQFSTSCMVEAISLYTMFFLLILEGGCGLWRKFFTKRELKIL